MRLVEYVVRVKISGWKKVLLLVLVIEVLSLYLWRLIDYVIMRINEVMWLLELLLWNWDIDVRKGIGRIRENVWSWVLRWKKM